MLVVFFETAFHGWQFIVSEIVAGYDSTLETQPDSVLIGINTLMTAVPAVILFIGLILMFRFPINRIKHNKLAEALEKKKRGEVYSTEGFEDIF